MVLTMALSVFAFMLGTIGDFYQESRERQLLLQREKREKREKDENNLGAATATGGNQEIGC